MNDIHEGGHPSDDLALRVGVILDLAEADYAYGTGRLVLVVERIGADPIEHRGTKWVFLVGRELRWDGRAGPRRQATVRASAIRGALRPDCWLPARYQ
jgi:hypothetical protein